MKLHHALAALLVALALPTIAIAQPAVPTFATRIGDTDLALPLPAGFVTLPPDATALQGLASTMAPSTNRVLALLVNQNDLALIAKKQPPRLGRYVLVETFVDFESATLSSGSMASLKEALRAQYTSVMAQVTPEVRSQLDAAAGKGTAARNAPELALDLGDMAPIEFFESGSNAITMVSLNKVGVKAVGQPHDVLLAAAFTTVLVNGKLVYFYVYSEYKGAADLAWVRSATVAWLASIRS